MSDKINLKQRIIGGIILVSLTVIALPFLMDEPRPEMQILDSNVDPFPEHLPQTTIKLKQDKFAEQPKLKAVSTPTVKQEAEPKAAPKAAPKVEHKVEPKVEPKAASKAKSWVVQVVSYRSKSRKRADTFLKKMQKRGYNIKLIEDKKRGMLRLVIDGFKSLATAKAMSKKIDEDFKVDKVKSMVKVKSILEK